MGIRRYSNKIALQLGIYANPHLFISYKYYYLVNRFFNSYPYRPIYSEYQIIHNN
ncbi:hypothetical protein BDA99DRAFT_498387 [Phascolomyces articulosus]|uniref:Uncharacterized protein n=1 Tax=Phascolomyces articulosus TaxID=60185 RepID=A0AAD5KKP8_9FUNG|nr:hypothetical protein BDA99DRAFT_498387 [Phascolomyces articulosus]